MKKYFAILGIALMSAFATATASATTGTEASTVQNEKSIKFNIIRSGRSCEGQVPDAPARHRNYGWCKKRVWKIKLNV